jgi:uncharacterized membrane protein YhaH (DUF805 family)
METSIFSWDGRIKRSTYWFRFLMVYGAFFVMVMVLVAGAVDLQTASIITNLVFYHAGAFMIIQGIKRMHDVGKSGGYLLIPFYSFVLAVSDGTEGSNQYGADPKPRPVYS